MPKDVIRPDGVDTSIFANQAVVTGAASANAALSDSSDASYASPGLSCQPLALTLGTTVIPAGDDIASVVPGARFRFINGPDSIAFHLALLGSGIYAYGTGGSGSAGRDGTAGIVDRTYGPYFGAELAPDGSAWSQAVLDALRIVLHWGYYDMRLHELFADVYHLDRPAVTVAATTPSDTTRPPITLTVSALIEDFQQDGTWADGTYEIKAFPLLQTLEEGFDPAVDEAAWTGTGSFPVLAYDDGVTPSTAELIVTPDIDLPMTPNPNVKLYARARRSFAGAGWGDWALADVEIDTDPPTNPGITALCQPTQGRVRITANPFSKVGHSDPYLSIERSSNGGTTYTPVPDCTLVAAAYGTMSFLYDYEAPQAVALKYRARVKDTYGGGSTTSGWVAVDVSEGPMPRSWDFKVPADPTLTMAGVHVLKDPEYKQTEDIGVFRPKGRTYPVVVSMGLGGADGAMIISTRTAAEWTALVALREYQGPILVQSPFGWLRWIRIVTRSWAETGTASAPRRRARFEYLEVEAP